MNKAIKILIFVVIVVAIAIAGFFLWPDTATDVPNDGDTIDTSDWQTYTNEEYGFSFKYPADWFIVNCDESDSRYNFLIMLEDIEIGCSYAMSGRINIRSAKTYNPPKDDEIKYIIVDSKEAKQKTSIVELVGGEGEKIDCEPMYKTVITYINYNNIEDIVIDYNELFSLKEGVDNRGFKIDMDYSNIYNSIISTFKFIK